MRRYIYNFLATVSLIFISGIFPGVKAQNYCVSGNCNSNTYINSVDPNTIEYDNMVSVFHSTLVRESDGKVKAWGQGIAQDGTGQTGNVAPPQEVNSTNYGTGTNQLSGTILKFAGASNQNDQQFAVLTTSGLYIWGGAAGTMVPLNDATNNVSAGSFRKAKIGTYNVSGGATKADGLPDGVTPADVKMMFGTRDGLAIVTCTGAAWMISSNNYTYGDGANDSDANDRVWHRVSTASNTPLTKVVAVRGTYRTMMALTSEGNIYTWGVGARLGDNNGSADLQYATLMHRPEVTPGTPVAPKMIGMTYSSSTTGGNVVGRSYYLLATDGKLYSMGQNAQRQLGDGSTTARNNWVQVTASTTISGTTYSLSNNIVWISPQEHDGNGSYAAINVITNDGKLWAWGSNNNGMIAGNTVGTGDQNPLFMPGRTSGAYDATKLNLTDRILAVEMGGHTTLTIKQCTTKFGYVGHKIRGSMANNTTDNGTEPDYNYGDTAVLSVCGAISAPVVQDLKVCEGTTANLADAEPTSLPTGATGINWWTDAAGTIPVSNPTAVGPGTYYATYEGLVVKCPTPMTVSYLQPGDPGYGNCACYNPAVTPGTGPDTKVGITLLQRAGNDAVGQWPMARKSGHVALESNTKGFVVTRVATTAALSNISTPKEGMMVYDGEAKCLKIYSDGAWKCFNQPACP